LASVSALSSPDFRANPAPQQNPLMVECEAPFSTLLNAVTEKKGAREQDAPKLTECRDEAPTRDVKLEADDRQAKRQDQECTTTTQSDTNATPITCEQDGDDTQSDSDMDQCTGDEALLTLTLSTCEQATPELAGDCNVEAEVPGDQTPTAGVVLTTDVQTDPALATTIAKTAAMAVDTKSAKAPQNAAGLKPQLEIAPTSAQAEADIEIALPQVSAETLSSLLKPVKTPSALDVPVQMQPGSVKVENATPIQAPAPLEMLNAAISKHLQLSLGTEANEQSLDAPKPLLSSNAVAPNFALTAQVNAPVNVQTQQVMESRAVPLDQLAVEIATRANKGERRFDIRLDPPELGRIDVRLEIDSKGNTSTKLIVERSETLDMLQRDARGLEKALQNAGLKLDAGGMQFSLQQDAQTHQNQQNHAPDLRGRPDLVDAETEIMTEISVGNASLAAKVRGGVDIRI
jgi:flagellar hook-length control protein FliK